MERRATRRGNWWALGIGTALVAVAYFLYGVAMASTGGGQVALSLLLAVAAFFAVALVSGREEGWKRALQASLVLVLLALPLGLLTRLIGAAVGIGIGIVISLNPPPFTDVFRNRLVAVVLVSAYALVLLVVLPPAGVMTGALGPPLAVGLADEFSAWRSSKTHPG